MVGRDRFVYRQGSVKEGEGMRQADEGRKSRVLLAEDDVSSQKLVRMILERQYEVVAVDTGAAAVDAYGSDDFDLVLLDLMMPNMDGFEAARRIRGMEQGCGRPPVPILA